MWPILWDTMDTKKVVAIVVGLLMVVSPFAFILGQLLT